jgi:hypothetical protein
MPEPREDLAAIRRLMEESQAAAGEDGRHFLLWGTLTAAGLLGTYAGVTGALAIDPRWLWGVLVALGWIGSFWIGARGNRQARVRTLGRRLLAVVWTACGVTLSLIAAAGLFGGAVSPRALSGLVSVVVAGGFLASAVLTGHRWLGAVAAAWWFGGGMMLFFPGLYTLPLLAAMTVALQVVPGAVLYRRSRRRDLPQPA